MNSFSNESNNAYVKIQFDKALNLYIKMESPYYI